MTHRIRNGEYRHPRLIACDGLDLDSPTTCVVFVLFLFGGTRALDVVGLMCTRAYTQKGRAVGIPPIPNSA